MVQPMKAALYFDNADGFGEWRILISTRAGKDLRYMRKKNPPLFDITLNKIKCVRLKVKRSYWYSSCAELSPTDIFLSTIRSRSPMGRRFLSMRRR